MPEDVVPNSTPVTPAVETPAAAPVVTETPAVATETPTVETPAVTEPVTTEPVVESVLGDAKTEVKQDGEKTVVAETKENKTDPKVDTKTESAADGKTPEAEVKIELPKYEDFKLPEDVKIDSVPLGEFAKLLGEIETGKLDHKGYQEAGQKFIDLAASATKQSIENLNKFYTEFHENQKKTWFEEFKKDPELGGEKFEETTELLRDAVAQYAGSPEQVNEFRQVMKETGVGNIFNAPLHASTYVCGLLAQLPECDHVHRRDLRPASHSVNASTIWTANPIKSTLSCSLIAHPPANRGWPR